MQKITRCTKSPRKIFGLNYCGVVCAVGTVLLLWPLVSLKYAFFGAGIGMALGMQLSSMWQKNQLQRILYRLGLTDLSLGFRGMPKIWQRNVI
jgi:hypothetical protein